MAFTAALPNDTLQRIGEEVARTLASAETTAGALFVTTPLLYPSGSTVLIRIDGSRDRFFVSDQGMGYLEAQMMGADRGYLLVAHHLIQGTGVSFDSRSFFVAEAGRDDLTPIVGSIANLSQRAVIETALKHEERRHDDDRALLLSRLDNAFGQRHVDKDVIVRGESTIEWEVTARISALNVISLFDYARPHKNSVTSTAAKFHDIARLSAPPRRFVTVNDIHAMGNFVGLLSQAASVIELAKTPDETLRKLAA